MERLRGNVEAEKAIKPTLFICFGLSGAGLTSVINELCDSGLAKSAPSQFVTRRLRPSEKFGDQYYPVTNEILAKVSRQIALQSEYYGFKYGFFHPALKRIERALDSGRNVIIDSGNSVSDWRELINNQFPIISIFFSPQNPFICIDRIVLRTQRLGQALSIEDLITRAIGNSQNIAKIGNYDYWVDTTEFVNIFPVTKSIIKIHSFDSINKHPKITVVKERIYNSRTVKFKLFYH